MFWSPSDYKTDCQMQLFYKHNVCCVIHRALLIIHAHTKFCTAFLYFRFRFYYFQNVRSGHTGGHLRSLIFVELTQADGQCNDFLWRQREPVASPIYFEKEDVSIKNPHAGEWMHQYPIDIANLGGSSVIFINTCTTPSRSTAHTKLKIIFVWFFILD